MVYNYLESYLRKPIYDLLLMLVLTIVLFFATPTILPSKHEFEIDSTKDTLSFVVNLVTRML